MNADPISGDKPGLPWRVLAEFTQPAEVQDEEWIAAGLAAALHGISLPPSDLERLTDAAAEAAARAGSAAGAGQAGPPLTVRLLISPALEASAARCACGLFVLERADGELAASGANRPAGPPSTHVVELYLYADAG
jgi:hypothetical protein